MLSSNHSYAEFLTAKNSNNLFEKLNETILNVMLDNLLAQLQVKGKCKNQGQNITWSFGTRNK